MLKSRLNSAIINNIPASARSLFATATLRQSGITFTGTLINGALGAVFYIFTARALGPASFGLMVVALNIAMLVSGIGDFGTDTGLVRFVSYYLERDRVKAEKFLKLSLKIKLFSGAVLTLLGIMLSGFVANTLFAKPELTPELRIAFVGVFTILAFGFVAGTLKAFQKFVLWSAVQIGSNLVRVGAILLFVYLGILNIGNSIWIYSLTLLVGFVVGMIFLVPKDFLKVKNDTSVAGEFFHYNKWIAGFTLIAALSSRLDTFISARLLTATDVGLYAAAYQLVYIVPQIVGALGTVFAPKLSSMGEKKKMIAFLKKSQLLVLGLAVLGVFSIPVVAFLVPYVFGAEYSAAIPIFVVLLGSMLVFLISTPVHNAILYYYSYPRLFVWLSVGHLAIIAVFGWFLISSFGVLGAAAATLIGSVFNFVVPAIWLVRKVRE